jgi:hypothetical protein
VATVQAIPDLVTNEHALSIVLASLSPGIGNSGTTLLDPKPAINAIVESALELADAGQLDDLAFPISPEFLELEGSPRTRVIQGATSPDGWPRDPMSHGSMQVSNAMGKAVDDLLVRVSKSLREQPFEDAGGHYFASGLGITSAGSEIEPDR